MIQQPKFEFLQRIGFDLKTSDEGSTIASRPGMSLVFTNTTLLIYDSPISITAWKEMKTDVFKWIIQGLMLQQLGLMAANEGEQKGGAHAY